MSILYLFGLYTIFQDTKIHLTIKYSKMSTVRAETTLIGFETTYIDSVRNVALFIAISIALLAFLKTHDVSFWLTIISVFLLLVIQVDFFSQRQNLVAQGVDIPLRVDMLWVGSTAFLFILIWLLWKMTDAGGEWSMQYSNINKDAY